MCHPIKILHLNHNREILIQDFEGFGKKNEGRHRDWEKFIAGADTE